MIVGRAWESRWGVGLYGKSRARGVYGIINKTPTFNHILSP